MGEGKRGRGEEVVVVATGGEGGYEQTKKRKHFKQKKQKKLFKQKRGKKSSFFYDK